MKWLSLLFGLVCLFVYSSSQAQMDVKTDPRIAPLLRQAANGQPDLVIFGRKPVSNMYVNMAVLDKTSKRLYWFTCYGTAYDSVQLRDGDYAQITSNAIDPFSFYKELCLAKEVFLDEAVVEYRELGKLALKDTSYNRRIVYNTVAVQSAHSTLQQLMALEGLFKKQCIKLSLFNCPSPSLSSTNEAFIIRKSFAGKTVNRLDTSVYYAASPLGFVAKISLSSHDSLKMLVYDGQDHVLDSMPLRPGKYTSLRASGEDVFLLYRGWLELQSQQLKEAIGQTTRLLNRQDTGLYIQAHRVDNREKLLLALGQLKSQQQEVEQRILNLTLPDKEMIGHMLKSSCPNGATQITYLSSGMGFAYTASHSRGEKEYELSNHLGNVMSTVSDRKLGVDDGGGNIAYYNVDVVNSDDYYPFGSLMPGRTYSPRDKYRYGFNGEEDDNEVKGDGNQQDYGMRIYDSRVGRFLSTDPIAKQYPELTPYQFASNSPIRLIDIDGLEGGIPIKYQGDDPLTLLIDWVKLRHHQGVINVDIAEGARKQAIQQGRANGDNIDWTTKALVYISPFWNGGANRFIPGASNVEDAKDAKKYFSQGQYGMGALSVFFALPEIGNISKVFKGLSPELKGLIKTVGKATDESKELVILTKTGKFEDALNVSKGLAGDLGEDAIEYTGKFGSQEGKVTGWSSANGKSGFRVDYDAAKGAHINWWNGKEKGAVQFSADQRVVDMMIENEIPKSLNH
ncbi:hypothetical protein DCC81_25085 [Chitinophaga parva]|uniref:RHS repeat-associated core domain-containing protein n=1 Tax=Chitinophaga parva TaxID=2169414 RepID=A0A2T7BBW6_9BACT|nr:RHS repeat-associated core domain-containing protein [Chitinophaga parva]PUZ21863.1 hypothetical protein DCC81_25085 [Chitinophaga parva]